MTTKPAIPCGELPEGLLAADFRRPDGRVVHSLTAHALAAMDRHRWIESEKLGHDVGESAMREWVDRYWKGFVRARLLEHLYGWRLWGAFDADDYGLLSRATVEYFVQPNTLGRTAEILRLGGENLDVINWALGEGQSLDPILWLLERIDINSVRHRLLTDHIRLFLPA